MDWIGPGSGPDDEWSMFIQYVEQKNVKNEKNKRARVEGGQMLLGIESRNESREANEINVVVSENSRWRRKFRNDVETGKNRNDQWLQQQCEIYTGLRRNKKQ